jgi:hypothetical protein
MRRIPNGLSAVVATSLALGTPLAAQVPAGDSTAAPIEFHVPAPTSSLLAAGLLSAGASWVGGAIVGWHLAGDPSDCGGCEFEGFGGALLGSILTPAIVVPATVNFVNDGAGSFGAGVFPTLAVGAVGTLVGLSSPNSPVILLVPIAQALTAIAVERATERP